MKLGILTNKVDISQLGVTLTAEVNALVISKGIDVIVFHHDWEIVPAIPHFAFLQEKEVWGFDAPVIATNVFQAEKLIRAPRPTRKYLYVWNLEWLYEDTDYNIYAHIYQHDNLELIARSVSHAQIIEQCWKKPAFIMDDFDHNVLERIATGKG